MTNAGSESAAKPSVRKALIAALLLVVTTVLLYAPVLGFDFIGYDDPLYVTQNRVVQQGLTTQTIAWSFEAGPGHALNYHPLTWLSHLLDVELFGLQAGAHHFSSALIHSAAAAALFLFMLRATGALNASLFVAALFAWHPMHVESVAWVAERKDVLSGLFFFLMLIAYVGYARRPRWDACLVVAILFALGLLAKPMLVTAPFVLLLLDYWPLKRAMSRRIVLEKLPLFALSAASSIATFIIQQRDGAVRTDENLPISWRLMNVPLAYVRYVVKLIWPSDLSVFYPYRLWTRWQVAGAVVALMIITLLALRRRAAMVGWLWFLGMLVPVIGIIQVGSQSMADRYSYLPSVGLFIAIVFPLSDRLRGELARYLAAAGALGILIALSFVTRMQLAHWRDELALFTHAARVTENNYLAEGYIGKALAARRQIPKALEHYYRALTINPKYYEVHYNLGSFLLRLERNEAAIEHLNRAVALRPQAAGARVNLGIALAVTGNLPAAEASLRLAVEIDPSSAEARASLGRVLLKQGKNSEAAAAFRRALELDPALEVARRGLGEAEASPP